MVSSLTVRVCVDGFHELSIGRVQSVEGVSSFKHGSGWIEACETGVAPKPHHCYCYYNAIYHLQKKERCLFQRKNI